MLMSNNHDNTSDLIILEDELESYGASANTETIDSIELGLRETGNVFNELQEVARRLAAYTSPTESFSIDRGVTFREFTSNMYTNTTTTVVTAVSGMPPLYSISNPSIMSNLDPSTQNSLREYEGLGGGNLGQDTQVPFQGSEGLVQDSTQYQLLGLRELVLNQQSNLQHQPEGATGLFKGHAYPGTTQQYLGTGGARPEVNHLNPRLLQSKDYTHSEVQQAIDSHFPSTVREIRPVQNQEEDKSIWLFHMLQWQCDESKDLYNWIQRDFEEIDDLDETRTPRDLKQLKIMALDQLEEIEEKCKKLEEVFSRDCLGKAPYARQQAWQEKHRSVRHQLRCSRGMIDHYTIEKTRKGESDPETHPNNLVREQIPLLSVSCQPRQNGPQVTTAVTQPVTLSKSGATTSTTSVETGPRFSTTEQYRNFWLSASRGQSVTAETVPVVTTPAGSKELRPPVSGTNYLSEYCTYQRPQVSQSHRVPEFPNQQVPLAALFPRAPELLNNQGPSVQQGNNVHYQQFLPREPAIPMPGIQEYNRVHGHYNMQPAIWPALYHNNTDIQIQLALQAQRQQELARQTHEVQMNQALEIAKMAQQGNTNNIYDKFTKYENMSFPTFDGNHILYQAFRTDFDSRMFYAKIPERVKGCYLYNALEGAAKDYVGNTGTWVNRYAELWEKLDSRYANRWTLAAETIKATLISEVPKGSLGNHTEVVRYIDQQVNMIESIKQLDLTPEQLAVNTLLMKLPEFMAEPIRNGLRIRRKGTQNQEDFKFTPEEFAEVVNDTVLNMDKLYPTTTTTLMQNNVSQEGGASLSKGSDTQCYSGDNVNKGESNHTNTNNNDQGEGGHRGRGHSCSCSCNDNHNGNNGGNRGGNYKGNSGGGYKGSSEFQGSPRPLRCYMCQGEHRSASCTKYTTPHEKRDALIAQNKCPGCARATHYGQPCELFYRCRVCKSARHYDYLCIWKEPESNK